MKVPAVAAVARDPRMQQVAQAVLGQLAIPYRATLFAKSADSNWLVVWHQDTALPLQQREDRPGWGPWSIKEGVLYAHAPEQALSQVVACGSTSTTLPRRTDLCGSCPPLTSKEC